MALPKSHLAEDYYGYENYDPDSGNVFYGPKSQPIIPSKIASVGGGGGGGGGGFGGGSFDYSGLINSDALLGQQKTDLAADSVSDASSRASAIQRALVQWGLIPDFFNSANKLGLNSDTLGYLKSDVTDRTRQLAEANTKEGLSLSARINKAHTDQIRAIKNALAARGMAGSGEMGYQLGEEAQQHKQGMTDAEQQTLGYITGAINAFAQAEKDRKRQLAEYMMAAAERQRGLLGDAGGSGGGAGGGNLSDFMYGSSVPGYSDESLWSAANANAPAGQRPAHIMHNGEVTNGGIYVKYIDQSGLGNTIWIPLPQQSQQSSASAPSAPAAPAALAAPAPPPPPASAAPTNTTAAVLQRILSGARGAAS